METSFSAAVEVPRVDTFSSLSYLFFEISDGKCPDATLFLKLTSGDFGVILVRIIIYHENISGE